ncbi:MAG: RNA-binding transcriptional accessory protein [Bacteroidales bacterium]|nr:RNA-binding transcriptional accessory protein [Bacteroidales bacterium]
MLEKLYINTIAGRLDVKDWQVEHCIELFEEGATVPFISRYRKERTGALDEVQVAEIRFHYQKFLELDKRKTAVLASIEEQGKLDPQLEKAIKQAVELQTLEDLYLPYRPKRRTRASMAKEKGLEPLAAKMMTLQVDRFSEYVKSFVNEKVKDVEEALQGAKDIIAENLAERQEIRQELRSFYVKSGRICSKIAKGADEEEAEKFQNYFDFSEDISRMPAHRVLAVLRGAEEGCLSVKVSVDETIPIKIINRLFYKGQKCSSFQLYEQLEDAVGDAYKRLLHPSIENEAVKIAKERADLESVKVFGENLRQLLLAPPVGQKRTLAIDPGFRTGCKVVCLDEQGALLHNDTIYPHPPANEKIMAMKKISNMVESYKIEVIAIGNGTASRETEAFIKRLSFPHAVKVYSVSEDGASIYSASPVAREEFPQYDVTVRGAVSIGRRLMDPLAELVKIDPKSLGIGQYQHDVDQSLLKEKLDDVVVSCVNSVGVNLNTASKHLLSYISGIGPALAQNIVDYRTNNGAFTSRAQLLKVKRLGEKVYEQAAGFLRIPGAENPLDNSAVHPERYELVSKMAASVNLPLGELVGNKEKIDSIDISSFVDDQVGLPTLNDIIQELAKPGRDPRSGIKVLEFSNEIHSIEDVKPGMELPGIITNITNFGAFVDVGIKQNGLIHVSNMADRFISNPAEVVKLHQHVQVRVLEVDVKRNRIQLKLLK